jgi:hypothetical protein
MTKLAETRLQPQLIFWQQIKTFLVVTGELLQLQLTAVPSQADYAKYCVSQCTRIILTFSVRHLIAIKSTAGRSFLGIKPLPALQQM